MLHFNDRHPFDGKDFPVPFTQLLAVVGSCFPAITATGCPPFCVPCFFFLVKERFLLSKRRSLLVLYIIVFYPLWMLICIIKLFLTQLLLPYEFHGSSMRGILFFFFIFSILPVVTR